MNKIIANLISAILILIMATSAILIVYAAIFVGDKSVLGFRIFSVVSRSMGDTIKQGELILTKKVSKQELQPGTIISFISSSEDIFGEVNTHRISRIENDTYYTKGDANDYEDKTPTKFDDIIGKVIWHSGFIGKFISWAQKPKNMLCYIILPTVIFAFCDVGKGIHKIVKVFSRKKKRIFKLGTVLLSRSSSKYHTSINPCQSLNLPNR